MSMVVGKKENGEDITALNLDGLSFDGDMFVAPSLIEEPNLEVRATPLPVPRATPHVATPPSPARPQATYTHVLNATQDPAAASCCRHPSPQHVVRD